MLITKLNFDTGKTMFYQFTVGYFVGLPCTGVFGNTLHSPD